MDTQGKKEFVTRFFEYMGDGARRQPALDMMAPDASGWIPGIGTWTKEQLADGMAAADRCFVGRIVPEILGITAEGDRLAVESVSDAQVVNGARYINRYHCLVVFDGDRIGEVREYCDTKYAADTLGPVFASGAIAAAEGDQLLVPAAD